MTYEEAIDAIVSREEARREIEEQHCLNFADFVDECGDHDEYDGSAVLAWLGY